MYCLVLYIFLLGLVGQVLPEKCITPDKKEGECVSLYSCPALAAAIVAQKSEAIEFVRRSNCGGTGIDPKVCCGRSPPQFDANNNSANHTTATVPKKSLLADRRYCGYQHSDDYFRSENDTSLDEFPWLAYLLYENENGTRETLWKCSGALINKRYVLTQDLCTKVGEKLPLVGVRLGDHDIKTETDCAEHSSLEECSLPYEDYGIESIINYSGRNKIDGHNLALIRLNRTTEYSDYIRPICLPQPSTAAKIGDALLTSGWGFAFFGRNPKKTKVFTKLASNAGCARYAPILHFTENHLCTRDVDDGRDFPWIFNFGGPVMLSVKSQWQVEGIVDLGGDHIQMHIKVANYVEWIEQNVKL